MDGLDTAIGTIKSLLIEQHVDKLRDRPRRGKLQIAALSSDDYVARTRGKALPASKDGHRRGQAASRPRRDSAISGRLGPQSRRSPGSGPRRWPAGRDRSQRDITSLFSRSFATLARTDGRPGFSQGIGL